MLEQVREALKLRESQLIDLVRELYHLASIEKEAGKVSHVSRGKLFKQCAAIFESIGAKAFSAEELGI